MEKKIVRDTFFLAGKAGKTTPEDLNDVRDLIDTFQANRHRCVGMAANMIGVRKRFIVFELGGVPMVMINPYIISKKDPYESEEGCLSLSGTRKTTRYETITVRYQDLAFKEHTGTFTGMTARIIQHETDHCDGIII